ncbi:hypothetical protein [Bacteroides sp. 51]|uniref:hypothetical protein n=1 Tax=Bacteroides sp. 51 TaxID=2302938 RepID=UPI0013D50F6D|nr:hypothetical protein [Bacteroides sp. 51]NDV83911.1 hypothetical protein [Bacteroides sp. 51]
MKSAIKLIFVSPLFLLISCAGDCKQVEIEKAEWITRFEDYYITKDTMDNTTVFVDTLVSYSVVEHKLKREYKKDSKGKINGQEVVHFITIKNNNREYTNSFAARISGKEYNEKNEKWSDIKPTTRYIDIPPESSHTFILRLKNWWRNESSGYDEGNVSVYILQKPTNVSKTVQVPKKVRRNLIRRIDELHLSTISINTCEQSAEALGKQYQAVKDLYYSKVDKKDQKEVRIRGNEDKGIY